MRSSLLPSTLWRGACVASNGTSGFRQISRSRPSSSSTLACSVFFSAPSTQVRPLISTGAYRPGSAALACTASEIGTSSRPGSPKGTASPLSRSVATSTSLRLSWRKSLLRPGSLKMRARRSCIAWPLKRPVGSARPRRSKAAMRERRLMKYW